MSIDVQPARGLRRSMWRHGRCPGRGGRRGGWGGPWYGGGGCGGGDDQQPPVGGCMFEEAATVEKAPADTDKAPTNVEKSPTDVEMGEEGGDACAPDCCPQTTGGAPCGEASGCGERDVKETPACCTGAGCFTVDVGCGKVSSSVW